MQDLVELILKKIVDHPKDMVITENQDEEGNTVINIELNDEDKPLVIGKRGRNISALRDLASVLARKEGKKVFLKIVE